MVGLLALVTAAMLFAPRKQRRPREEAEAFPNGRNVTGKLYTLRAQMVKWILRLRR